MLPKPPLRSFRLRSMDRLDEIKGLDQYMLLLVHPCPPPSLRMGGGSNHPFITNHRLDHHGVDRGGGGRRNKKVNVITWELS